MRLFACLLNPLGNEIPESARRMLESTPRTRSLVIQWQCFDGAAVLTASDDGYGDPLVVCEGHEMAVGVARLDNRRDVERAAQITGQNPIDLQVLLNGVMHEGARCIPHVLGDFAFVIWNAATRTAVAARDALGVKKLYYTNHNGLIAFADRAETLAQGERYDVRFLAERVAGAEASPEVSAFEGVKAVPPGTMLLLQRGTLTPCQYWSPEKVAASSLPPIPAGEAASTLRDLLGTAVASRLSVDGKTWAQLSGGLDSSSVVSVAQWLATGNGGGLGVSGTVTYVDRQGTGADEREYSSMIANHWRISNVPIVDPPIWYDEQYPPPRLDQPRLSFMFYPRECRLCDIVRGAGARVLLTGQGPDEYLRGSMFFFADWLARGRIRAAVREMVRRAAIGRVSFWELAYGNAVMPLLPRRLQRRLGPEVTRLPAWIHPMAVRRFGLGELGRELGFHAGPVGQKYRTTVIKGVAALQGAIGSLVLDDELDVRHPFLDRRLVEFGLRLAPELTTQPYEGKWVLREAMRDILPEAVRTRVGKGTQIERHARSLIEQRSLLEPLVREPILADLGVIDGARLRAAFEAMPWQPKRTHDPQAALQQVLAVEAWLQIRAGRWPGGTN